MPERRRAVARPFDSHVIPRLYVFGPDGEHITRFSERASLLQDPVFVAAEREAYWVELLDGYLESIPWLGACSQAAILDRPVNFEAPPGGLLFMQYLTPGCHDCGRVTRAIRKLVAAHPELPVRWVQVMVPPSVGKAR